MRLRQILAVVDFSPNGIHAGWRAARVAWAHTAELCLTTPAQIAGACAAPPVGSRSDLSFFAEEIAATIGIQPKLAASNEEDAIAAILRHARSSDLIVVSGELARHRPLRSWYLGCLAEQILRDTSVPVLITHRPSGVVYRRGMVVIEPQTEGVGCLLKAARWFCEPQGLRACQVLDSATRRHLLAADLPPATVHAQLERDALRATAGIAKQLAQAGMPAVQAKVLHGDPLTELVAEQHRGEASLVVIAKPQRSWWADVLQPALARRLIDRLNCDVLWLPTPIPSRVVARHRLERVNAGPR